MTKTKPKEIKALLRSQGMTIAGMARRLRNDKYGDIDRAELERRIDGVKLQDKYVLPISGYLGVSVDRVRDLFGLDV